MTGLVAAADRHGLDRPPGDGRQMRLRMKISSAMTSSTPTIVQIRPEPRMGSHLSFDRGTALAPADPPTLGARERRCAVCEHTNPPP